MVKSNSKQRKKTEKKKKTVNSHYVQDKSADSIAAESAFIGTYEQAPKFVKDNVHILGGYRIGFDTPGKILKSLFMLHNQTVNVWSHFLGAVIVIVVLGFSIAYISPAVTNNVYRFKIQNKVDELVQALDDSTLLKDLGNTARNKLTDIRDSLYTTYGEFKQHTKEKLHQTDQRLGQIKKQLEHKLENSIKAIVELKEHFETHKVKQIVESVKQAGDRIENPYAQAIKGQIQALKQKFVEMSDSETYDFIDIAHSPNPNFVSRWPIFVFLCSAAICLLCSAIFHLFYPMSGDSYKFFMRFDYAGINLLISGSTFPSVYYGMYCNVTLATFYLTLVSIIATGLFTLSLFEWMHREEHRTFKSLCYGGFGVFVAVPVFHMLLNQWLYEQADSFTFLHILPFYFALGFCYLAGLYMYTVKCPQRHYPGKLDICGHSHQIWHVLVFAGIVFTYIASLMTFEQRKKCTCG